MVFQLYLFACLMWCPLPFLAYNFCYSKREFVDGQAPKNQTTFPSESSNNVISCITSKLIFLLSTFCTIFDFVAEVASNRGRKSHHTKRVMSNQWHTVCTNCTIISSWWIMSASYVTKIIDICFNVFLIFDSNNVAIIGCKKRFIDTTLSNHHFNSELLPHANNPFKKSWHTTVLMTPGSLYLIVTISLHLAFPDYVWIKPSNISSCSWILLWFNHHDSPIKILHGTQLILWRWNQMLIGFA